MSTKYRRNGKIYICIFLLCVVLANMNIKWHHIIYEDRISYGRLHKKMNCLGNEYFNKRKRVQAGCQVRRRKRMVRDFRAVEEEEEAAEK